ncbi:MAG: hypothetical protein OXL36_06670 [Bryobacterales bacterium]|nr:hypothetical protein [Bryobacterales bacterium]MDE0296616.1 hypothetical protein [Bryobacterales bacterium]
MASTQGRGLPIAIDNFLKRRDLEPSIGSIEVNRHSPNGGVHLSFNKGNYTDSYGMTPCEALELATLLIQVVKNGQGHYTLKTG